MDGWKVKESEKVILNRNCILLEIKWGGAKLFVLFVFLYVALRV